MVHLSSDIVEAVFEAKTKAKTEAELPKSS